MNLLLPQRANMHSVMAKCENCSRYFLPHEKIRGDDGIVFCSVHCKLSFKYINQPTAAERMMKFMNSEKMNEFMNTSSLLTRDNRWETTCPTKGIPTPKIQPLTISDLFSLDNEEEFKQYLNNIIKEKQ